MRHPTTAAILATALAALGLAATGDTAVAQDALRTWTDKKGRSLEAQLLRQETKRVLVRRGDGREFYLNVADLSEDDLAYLRTQPVEVVLSDQNLRFDTFEVDRRDFEPLAGPVKVGAVTFAGGVKTPHFLVFADDKVRDDVPGAYGEACERLWMDIAKDFPGLAESFGERRMAVFVFANDEDYLQLGEWFHEQYSDAGWFERALAVSTNWTTLYIASARFTKKFADEHGVIQTARVFRVNKYPISRSRDLHWFSRIHFVGADLIRHYLEPVRENGEFGLSMVSLGYSYFKEGEICDRIETEVTFGSSDIRIEGFKNGRAWPAAIKRLLENPATHPTIAQLLSTASSRAQPIDVGCSYGLIDFIKKHPRRIRAFKTLIEGAREEKRCPDPPAFARAMGFESPAEFEKAWVSYMQSDQFEFD